MVLIMEKGYSIPLSDSTRRKIRERGESKKEKEKEKKGGGGDLITKNALYNPTS